MGREHIEDLTCFAMATIIRQKGFHHPCQIQEEKGIIKKRLSARTIAARNSLFRKKNSPSKEKYSDLPNFIIHWAFCKGMHSAERPNCTCKVPMSATKLNRTAQRRIPPIHVKFFGFLWPNGKGKPRLIHPKNVGFLIIDGADQKKKPLAYPF